MSRKFITLDEAVQFVNDLIDDEECKVVVLLSKERKVTDKESDDGNLTEQFYCFT